MSGNQKSLKHPTVQLWGPEAPACELKPDTGAREQQTPVDDKTMKIFYSLGIGTQGQVFTSVSYQCLLLRLIISN